MADLQLPPSINDARSQALLGLINRLKALDLAPILVYRIASLVDSAVLAMAWQWDVLNPLIAAGLTEAEQLSFSSWDAITNIDKLLNVDLLDYEIGERVRSRQASFNARTYRTLILLSTALHSSLGTPAALHNALSNLGFPGVVILEGQNSWGGSSWPADEGWAVFRVLINLLTVEVPPDVDIQQLLVAVCNYWKPARCWLDSVQFGVPVGDLLLPAPSDSIENIFLQLDRLRPAPLDSIAAPAWPLSDVKTIVPLHDERYYHTGTTYGANEPHVADDGVVVNGVVIAANG